MGLKNPSTARLLWHEAGAEELSTPTIGTIALAKRQNLIYYYQ